MEVGPGEIYSGVPNTAIMHDGAATLDGDRYDIVNKRYFSTVGFLALSGQPLAHNAFPSALG